MKHISWLVKTHELTTTSGCPIEVWELKHEADPQILSSWAKHFREQYCRDDIIDALLHGTGLSRQEYLNQIVFPSDSAAPGPSIRSGDFAETLIADYLEYTLNYWVPRTRFDNKAIRNESVKGSDVIGLKFIDTNTFSLEDTLTIIESKAQLASASSANRLQDAIEDSKKDPRRKAESLNAIKRRFLEKGDYEAAKKIERFQNVEDNPYKEISGAVAVISTPFYSQDALITSDISSHPNSTNIVLMVIHGSDLMELVHELYRRAANEA